MNRVFIADYGRRFTNVFFLSLFVFDRFLTEQKLDEFFISNLSNLCGFKL